MAGRKRKPGRREPSGRLARSSEDARQVVWQGRRRVHGLRKEEAQSELAGSAPGRLRLEGLLSERQLRAAREYEALWLRYRRALAGPAGDASPPIPAEPKGHDGRDTLDADRRTMLAMSEARHALAGTESLIYRAVQRLVVDDVDLDGYDLVNARLGLNGLADLWKYPRERDETA